MQDEDAVRVDEISSTPQEFVRHLRKAKEIVKSWPDWKRNTPATSYPRPSIGPEEPTHRV